MGQLEGDIHRGVTPCWTFFVVVGIQGFTEQGFGGTVAYKQESTGLVLTAILSH